MVRVGAVCIALIWRAILRQKGLRQRLRFAAAVATTFLAIHPAGASVGRHADHSAPTLLRIAPGGWGKTRVEDLRVVLDAVVAELGRHFPGRSLGTIDVVPGTGGPIVLYDRSADGAYVVQLSARDERWFQFVYQFSHELCHIYSNFDNKVAGASSRGNQWFEESVCEAAALYTLRRLAASWADAPPGEKWRSHAEAFNAYAEYFLHEPHRRLPATKPFASWFQANRSDLHANPYFRDKNEVVSNLLLPLFEQAPESWGAIGYLNHDRDDATKDFAEFLGAWHEACPSRYREVVERVIALFGDAVPKTTLVAAPLKVPTAPALAAQ